MKIVIAADHAGFELKEKIKKFLEKLKIKVIDFGTHSPDSVDYPDYAALVAEAVSKKRGRFGILICGTGTGMAIVANKFRGIRAANCYNEMMAKMARAHNDANVLTLGGRVLKEDQAKKIVRTFLVSNFAGERHSHRVRKIHQLDSR